MKPEQQRIAIAKACGWTDVAFDYSGTGYYLFGYPKEFVRPDEAHIDFAGLRMTLGQVAKKFVPDYPNDLNAMHEAENVLITGDNSEEYDRYLREAMQDAPDYIWHATSSQRAEAFLRTLNLWTE